jgi:hypothetical protein
VIFIKQYIIEKLLDEGISIFKILFKKNSIKIVIRKQDLETALLNHLNYVENISRQIGFKEMLVPKSLKSLYISLDIQLAPKRLLPYGFKKSLFKIDELVAKDSHLVILGDPGAGKTTSIKSLAQKLLHEESELLKKYSFPLLIQLRDLDENESLFSRISEILGINVFYKLNGVTKLAGDEDFEKYRNSSITQYLDCLKPLLLIDGFDEISEEKQNSIQKELRSLCNSLNEAKVILTCRSGAFDVFLENTETFEICSLDEDQINYFISKWFEDKKIENGFKAELNKSVFKDLTIRPLTLSHLCALYEKLHRLPEKPKYIYRRLISLLLEEWDSQRAIVRESAYYNFETERKYEFLAHLAFQLTIDTPKKRFTEDELLTSLKKFYTAFSIYEKEIIPLVNEIESHNGIFVKSSYDTYEFSHKSMQEYLCADHIVRKGSIPLNLLSKNNLPNEMAIAVCLSATPNNEYFYKTVYGIFFKSNLTTNYFINQFLLRLSLEKPDFCSDVFLAITIYLIYHTFYTSESVLELHSISRQDYDNQISNAEGDFPRFFNNILTAPNVASSFRRLMKNVRPKILSERFVFFEFKSLVQYLPYEIPEIETFKFPPIIYVNKKYTVGLS